MLFCDNEFEAECDEERVDNKYTDESDEEGGACGVRNNIVRHRKECLCIVLARKMEEAAGSEKTAACQGGPISSYRNKFEW